MEYRGDQPTITSSAFHWGTREPRLARLLRGRAADGDRGQARIVLRRFSHVRLRVGREPAAVLRRRRAPRDVLQRRGGILPAETLRADAADHQHGDRRQFPASPGRTTVWPQRLLVDWVRVYELAEEPGTRTFRNGGFDENGGSPAGWHIFGNIIDGKPNVLVQREAVRDGTHSLKISGQGIGGGQLFRRDSKHQCRRRRAGACKALGVRAFARTPDRLEGPRLR